MDENNISYKVNAENKNNMYYQTDIRTQRNTDKTYTLYNDGDKRMLILKLRQENEKLRRNQEKFMNYLQSMLDNEYDIFGVVRVADVLSEYEEIIGSEE